MDTVKVDGKEVPLMNAKVKTTIKHKETGVIYKDEKEERARNRPCKHTKRCPGYITKT